MNVEPHLVSRTLRHFFNAASFCPNFPHLVSPAAQTCPSRSSPQSSPSSSPGGCRRSNSTASLSTAQISLKEWASSALPPITASLRSVGLSLSSSLDSLIILHSSAESGAGGLPECAPNPTGRRR
eukprot:Selendium_serpulae@DN4280_c0_g1_i1.p1